MTPLKPSRPTVMASLIAHHLQNPSRISSLVAGALIAVTVMGHGLPVSATPLNSWEHHCVAEDEGNAKVCTTELRSRDRDIEAIFYFARGPNGPVPFVALSEQAKFGALTVQVDDKDSLEADSCTDGVCYFEADKSRLLIKQFRGGRKAHVVIDAPDGQTLFDSDITLMGFSAAYKLY
jgi:hypothetical protein